MPRPRKYRNAEERVVAFRTASQRYRLTPKGKEAVARSRQREARKRLLEMYGLTPEQKERMLKEQNYCFAICGDALDLLVAQKVCIDHDHVTGTVRAILCNHCNMGLGQFFDDPSRLEKAIKYLTGFGKQI